MPIMQMNSEEIRCYRFTQSGKIIKCTLQNLLNQDEKSLGLIEINIFGINQVYSIVNVDKLKSILSYMKKCNINAKLSLARIMGDSPIVEGMNMKSNSINLNDLTILDLISIAQLYEIINGMNNISTNEIDSDTYYQMALVNNEIDFTELDFGLNENYINKFKYIIRFENNNYDLCNSMYTDEFEGIFVKILEFNCWQYLSRKKFKTLTKAKLIEIKHAITDSPRCFSNVAYYESYNIDTFDELLKYSIYIPIDIYFDKIFDDYKFLDNQFYKSYDAMELIITLQECTVSVLLTYDELGIDNDSEYTKIRYMNKFCLLKLINNVISLKP